MSHANVQSRCTQMCMSVWVTYTFKAEYFALWHKCSRMTMFRHISSQYQNTSHTHSSHKLTITRDDTQSDAQADDNDWLTERAGGWFTNCISGNGVLNSCIWLSHLSKNTAQDRKRHHHDVVWQYKNKTIHVNVCYVWPFLSSWDSFMFLIRNMRLKSKICFILLLLLLFSL